MRYRIQTLSRQTAAVLSEKGSGKIHSLYRRTVNLQFGEDLFALQPAGSVLSPISLITGLPSEPFSRLCRKLSAGQPAAFQEGIITLVAFGEPAEFSCQGTAGIDLMLAFRLTDFPRPAGPAALEEVLAEVLTREFSGFSALFPEILTDTAAGFHLVSEKCLPAAGTDPRILSAAADAIRSSRAAYRDGDLTASADHLIRLIGLGIGLTPSGDDFLCGVLAGLTLCGTEQDPFLGILRDRIARNLNRTNTISAAFLSSAARGCFSEPVLQLSEFPAGEEIRRQFQAIGHSSGFDTLCGVLFGLSLPL